MTLPWFMQPNAREAAASRGCPAGIRPLIEAFLDKGYVHISGSVSPQICDRIVDRFRTFERVHADKLAPFRLADGHWPRLVNMHLAVPELFELFSHNPQALAVQDFLFGAETCLYTSLFYERGSTQPIHRDTPYFCTRPEYRYFGMWVALEDVDEDNGPLMVMEGGHLLHELDRPAIARSVLGQGAPIPPDSTPLFDAYNQRVAEQGKALGLTVRTLPVKKGDTIIWHPHLPHGGAPIRDPARTRFSFVMHTTPEGAAVYHQHAFFDPQRHFPETAPWKYIARDGRKYARHKLVSFAHQKEYAPEDLALA